MAYEIPIESNAKNEREIYAKWFNFEEIKAEIEIELQRFCSLETVEIEVQRI